MRTRDIDTTTTVIELQAGQSVYVQARRREVLLLQSGCIRLQESPDWLGNTFLGSRITLTEGQLHQLSCSGWMTIEALQNSTLLHDNGKTKHKTPVQRHATQAELTEKPLQRLRLWLSQFMQRHLLS